MDRDETMPDHAPTDPAPDDPTIDPVARLLFASSTIIDRADLDFAAASGSIDAAAFLSAGGCRFDFLDAESSDAAPRQIRRRIDPRAEPGGIGDRHLA